MHGLVFEEYEAELALSHSNLASALPYMVRRSECI